MIANITPAVNTISVGALVTTGAFFLRKVIKVGPMAGVRVYDPECETNLKAANATIAALEVRVRRLELSLVRRGIRVEGDDTY